MSNAAANGPPALKDPDHESPIAGAWRPMLRAVVQCFVEGDYCLARGVAGAEPVTAATAEQIRDYLAEYGATLVELPDDTWQTSVAWWTGTHWQLLVDLWTAEEGRSDLVLDGNVVETGDGPRLTIHLVYVPEPRVCTRRAFRPQRLRLHRRGPHAGKAGLTSFPVELGPGGGDVRIRESSLRPPDQALQATQGRGRFHLICRARHAGPGRLSLGVRRFDQE